MQFNERLEFDFVINRDFLEVHVQFLLHALPFLIEKKNKIHRMNRVFMKQKFTFIHFTDRFLINKK